MAECGCFFIVVLCRLWRSFHVTSVRARSPPLPVWHVTSETNTKSHQPEAFAASEFPALWFLHTHFLWTLAVLLHCSTLQWAAHRKWQSTFTTSLHQYFDKRCLFSCSLILWFTKKNNPLCLWLCHNISMFDGRNVCIYRFCTKSKKMFSSRAMLDKHVQLRHSLELQSHDPLTVQCISTNSITEKVYFFFCFLFLRLYICQKCQVTALQ